VAEEFLYLGISDHPAWVVVKANDYARQHVLTPFSPYQGKCSAAFRDIESEVIPMCRDQRPWHGNHTLGSSRKGKLISSAQRYMKGASRQSEAPAAEDLKVSEKLEDMASQRRITFRAVVSSWRSSRSDFIDISRLLHTLSEK
jgi:aryl-alcohol dehydrogenase-like predicted oxidoreductase